MFFLKLKVIIELELLRFVLFDLSSDLSFIKVRIFGFGLSFYCRGLFAMVEISDRVDMSWSIALSS